MCTKTNPTQPRPVIATRIFLPMLVRNSRTRQAWVPRTAVAVTFGTVRRGAALSGLYNHWPLEQGSIHLVSAGCGLKVQLERPGSEGDPAGLANTVTGTHLEGAF